MRRSHIIIAFAVVCMLAVYNSNSKVLLTPPTCDEMDLTIYTKSVWINGEKNQNEKNVVIYRDTIYFSSNLLNSYVSDSFVSISDTEIRIRRKAVDFSSCIRSENQTYISMDTLSNYVHINRNIFNYDGNIYLDTMLDGSINIGGQTYYLNNKKTALLYDKAPDCILKNGRGCWYGDNCIYVENDWEELYQYKISQIGL